jgi:MFS family permease
MPSATGIVADQFGPNRDRAVAMFTSILPIGGIVGPILGGILVSYWSWRMIFLINVPLGIVLIVLTIKFLPGGGPRRAAQLDRVGVGLLGLMILAIMFGFAFLGTGSISALSWKFLGFEGLGVAGIILFVRHIRTVANPLVPAMLLYGRGFGVVNMVNFIYGSAALGLPALVPLYAEQRFGMSTLHASTLLSARALGMIAVAGIASMALRRTGVRIPMAIGFVLIMCGLLLMSNRPGSVSAYLWLSLAAGVTGLGMGAAVPATNNASLQLAPEHVAALAGLRGMFRQSGAILALSVSTAILATSSNPGAVESRIFVVFAAILILTLPLTAMVPEHRGSW